MKNYLSSFLHIRNIRTIYCISHFLFDKQIWFPPLIFEACKMQYSPNYEYKYARTETEIKRILHTTSFLKVDNTVYASRSESENKSDIFPWKVNMTYYNLRTPPFYTVSWNALGQRAFFSFFPASYVHGSIHEMCVHVYSPPPPSPINTESTRNSPLPPLFWVWGPSPNAVT